jgi:hypothetical protein
MYPHCTTFTRLHPACRAVNYGSISTPNDETMESMIASPSIVTEAVSQHPQTMYTLHPKHKSVTSMWNEWFGLAEFRLGYPGSINGLEKDRPKSWRAHFNTAAQKQYSRLKFVIQQVQKRSQTRDTLDVLVEFDQLFSASPSLSGLEKHLKRLANCTSTEDTLNQTTNTSTTNSYQIQYLLPPHQGKPTNLEELNAIIHWACGYFTGDEIPPEMERDQVSLLKSIGESYVKSNFEGANLFTMIWLPRIDRFLAQ